MRKRLSYIVLLFFACTVLSLPAQNIRAIDSLKNILQTTQTDSIKLKTLLALSFKHQGFDADMALDYGKKALLLAQALNNQKGIGNAHNNLGDLCWYKGDYLGASEHYLLALKTFEKLNNVAGIADCYRNIGWIYYKQGNRKKGLEYFNKSLVLNTELNRKAEIASNSNDLGVIYTDAKEYEKAVEAYKKGLRIQEEIGSKMGMSANYGNLAVVYDYMGKTDLAIESVERSAALAREMGNKHHLSSTLCNLATFYANAGRLDEALVTSNESLRLGKEIQYKEIIKDCYQNLAELHKMRKEYEEAYKYELLLVAVKDSIYNESNSEQIHEMTAKYDSEKKELMISSLEKDNSLASEKLQRERYFKICLSLFCLMIAAFAFMLFRSNVNKKKANEELSLAYQEIELKNKDITDSINYSKRIQEASLPPKELKYRLFPDAFVLFKPKDIVSGDFYWFAEKDGKRVIAVCDCTGHGVPGALMSMIGNNILNQIVYEKGITSAGAILDELHLGIRKSLKQKEHQENNDGMDIALVIFNSETEIEFAGAQRPLWLIRHENHQLEEIRGNKFSIGGLQTEEIRKFDTHRLILEPKDCIYIFSDGIVDQFGGEHGKKFMSKNLKVLFSSIHDEPMAIQETIIEQTLEKWKGKREQVDDVLVIGVRI
jgi:serine phosphatase RsbU (regulator of sigma subunit)/Tfp pilus assembly protein PilF